MGKLLLLILGLFLVYAVLHSYRKRAERQGSPPAVREQEDMVRCEYCGVHLPRSESLLASGKFYCSVEHQPQRQKSE